MLSLPDILNMYITNRAHLSQILDSIFLTGQVGNIASCIIDRFIIIPFDNKLYLNYLYYVFHVIQSK